MTAPTRSELADRIAALEAVNAGTRLDALEGSEPPVPTSTASERLLEHAGKFEEAAADFRAACAALEPPAI